MTDPADNARPTIRQIAAEADFRNAQGPVKGLARLEKMFREMTIAERKKVAEPYAAFRALAIGRNDRL